MLATIPRSQKILVMVGVMLALLLAALDQTIVATALPRIVQDFNGLQHLSWVITAYLLASTVIVPIYGKLSDIYGRKSFILSAIVVFVVGSMLSGSAHSMIQLVIYRAIQGLGGGAIFANAFAVIGDLFPAAERGRWQGLLGGTFGLASVIGPTLGGWLTDHASWRWTFYINLPIGILALIAIVAWMPKITSDIKNRSIDYLGSFFLTSGLVTLLLGFIWGGSQYAWNSNIIFLLFFGAAASLLIFGLVERRAAQPILPLDLFRNKIFTVSMIALFFTGIGMFGAILYVPLFAQLVLGVSATNSGTILTPMMLGFVFASITAGQLTARTGRYKWLPIAGFALASVALYLMSRMTPTTPQSTMIVRMIMTGFGIGLTLPVFTLAVQNAFEHAKLGVATASTQLFRSIGATVGTAVLGGLLNAKLASQLGNLAKDPYVALITKASSNAHFDKVDANKLQGILTGPGRQQVEKQLAQLPTGIKPEAVSAFHGFIDKTKAAFAVSITEVFLIGAGLMAVAFVVTLFLKEIPLRKTHDVQPSQEAGEELAIEEGVMPAGDEPTVL